MCPEEGAFWQSIYIPLRYSWHTADQYPEPHPISKTFFGGYEGVDARALPKTAVARRVCRF
jgi:hypothetical protein